MLTSFGLSLLNWGIVHKLLSNDGEFPEVLEELQLVIYQTQHVQM